MMSRNPKDQRETALIPSEGLFRQFPTRDGIIHRNLQLKFEQTLNSKGAHHIFPRKRFTRGSSKKHVIFRARIQIEPRCCLLLGLSKSNPVFGSMGWGQVKGLDGIRLRLDPPAKLDSDNFSCNEAKTGAAGLIES